MFFYIAYRKENECCASDLNIGTLGTEDELANYFFLSVSKFPSAQFLFLVGTSWEKLISCYGANLAKDARSFTDCIGVMVSKEDDHKEGFALRQRLQQKMYDKLVPFLESQGWTFNIGYHYGETGTSMLDLRRIELVDV